jgi:hypothetical protein
VQEEGGLGVSKDDEGGGGVLGRARLCSTLSTLAVGWHQDVQILEHGDELLTAGGLGQDRVCTGLEELIGVFVECVAGH